MEIHIWVMCLVKKKKKNPSQKDIPFLIALTKYWQKQRSREEFISAHTHNTLPPDWRPGVLAHTHTQNILLALSEYTPSWPKAWHWENCCGLAAKWGSIERWRLLLVYWLLFTAEPCPWESTAHVGGWCSLPELNLSESTLTEAPRTPFPGWL